MAALRKVHLSDGCLNLAHDWGLILQTPTIHKLPGGKGRERVIGFAQEVLYLSKASPTVRDAAMLAADRGMRPNSELFSLEWINVHLESTQDAPQDFIHVPQRKTDAATRNILLTPRTKCAGREANTATEIVA